MGARLLTNRTYTYECWAQPTIGAGEAWFLNQSVVVAGRYKGELRAKDVLLEANSIFDGNLVADKVTLGGLVKGEVAANTLNVASSAKVEGNLKTNALSIDLGAEVSGSITRIS